MNRLGIEKRERVVAALVEGNSIRSTERMIGVHRDTIMRLLVDVGTACRNQMDETHRNLSCERVQVDEIWCYVGKKQRRLTAADNHTRVGDFWTFVAIDADTKFVPSFEVGKRTLITTARFIRDLSERIPGRVQISSDALDTYTQTIVGYFGDRVDYAKVVKSYVADSIGPGRYSPPKVSFISKETVVGRPEMDHASTSYVERQNLTMRMNMRRFTRLTNGFSKKLENLKAAVALHFFAYNYCRSHRTLGMTPAMACGLDERKWSLREVVELAEGVRA